MFTFKFYLLCLVTFLYICLCVGNSNMNKCLDTEKNALLKFTATLIDKNDILSSWKGEEDCCIWKGVTCDNSTHHVVKLELQPPLFNDDIIAQFGGNYFTSLSWVFNVSKVIGDLDLSYNSLQQSIPDGFENMTSLKYLLLSNNKLQGSIPKSFQSLCQLAILDLSFNKFSGQFSDFMQHLYSRGNSITELHLSNNQINGTLQYNNGQVSSLQHLSIRSNNLSGVISESHLSNLPNLRYLYVDQNPLSFNLSSNRTPPFQLIYFSASSCNLGPNFPLWLINQKSLTWLQISNNGISDYIPEWFWGLTPSLSYLDVSRNKLIGALPISIPSMQPGCIEITWDFSFNNFSGPLPSFPPQMTLLSVSNNIFSGSISSFCGTSYHNLSYLDLSNNSLSGRVLDCWGQFPKLKILNLATNNFLGRIPYSFGSLQSIETIHLNNNNFSGEFPPLARCSNLKLIDFGDNNIEGTIPTWVGKNLHRIIILRLRGNKFQGSIPESLCNLSNVQVLDLSNNNITGHIPHCLDHITALSNTTFSREPFSFETIIEIGSEERDYGALTDTVIVAWKGANREYRKNLIFLTAIDLSCNHLIGEIPQSMTMLVALHSLNLSNNNLIGLIPNNIGHMQMLESLDLSKNNLSGTIPESLSNVSFLSYMQLSFNNLSGKIPSGTQLHTFDADTYIGNPGLCGPPLSKNCTEGSNNIHRNDDEGDGDDDGFISFGFYISMGLGVIVGFWGVCGTLILKTSWRYAYFQFFNNMCDWIYVKFLIIATMKRRFQVKD